ncbi:hypothetical protein AAH978_08805 [Streptomyces sp. ZYX-F-203]
MTKPITAAIVMIAPAMTAGNTQSRVAIRASEPRMVITALKKSMRTGTWRRRHNSLVGAEAKAGSLLLVERRCSSRSSTSTRARVE